MVTIRVNAWRHGHSVIAPRSLGILRAQPRDLRLERQHPGDPGEVEPLGEQVADAVQPVDVGGL